MSQNRGVRPWSQVAALVLETQAVLSGQMDKLDGRVDDLEKRVVERDASFRVWIALWSGLGTIAGGIFVGVAVWILTRTKT